MQPTSAPSQAASTKFPYPSLPSGVDAIRVLTIEPGDFHDPLVGTLKVASFESKPKYVALSYTWKDAYQDNAQLPTSPPQVDPPRGSQRMAAILPKGLSTPSSIDESQAALTLNGHPHTVGHNLHLALLHLRPLTVPLTLWVDAICISQVDVGERNAQVALMSFIFMRAIKVVAWLGTKDYGSQRDQFQCMAIDWKAGKAQHFAPSLEDSSKMRASVEPSMENFIRLTESAYWTRLWMVQEVCLPRSLVFVYGANVWTWEDFREWKVLKAAIARAPLANLNRPSAVGSGFAAMLRLFDTRDTKHTNSLKLESLMKNFASSGCSEPRDRVYGLLGLANNVHPVSKTNASTNLDERHSGAPGSLIEGSTVPSWKATQPIKVDYSQSFFDVWANVVSFLYFRNMASRCQVTSQIAYSTTPDDWAGPPLVDDLCANQDCVNIVRTAGVVQEALDQLVDEDSSSIEECLETSRRLAVPKFRVMGYVNAVVIHLGPDYKSLFGSFQAHQDWIHSCEGTYTGSADLESLRKKNEEYSARITNYEKKDIARVRDLRSPRTFAWPLNAGNELESLSSEHVLEYQPIADLSDPNLPIQPTSPRICLGTDCFIGLVPSEAQVGDVLVRFPNCSAAVLMRSADSQSLLVSSTSWKPAFPWVLMGRADVAGAHESRNGLEHDTHTKQMASPAVYMDLDLRTLQMITASITTF